MRYWWPVRKRSLYQAIKAAPVGFATSAPAGFATSIGTMKEYYNLMGVPLFLTLRIWEKDEGGNDRLSGLLDLGVGAIYLGSASTPFSLKDSDNNLQGAIRSSGIFLKENGGAGTIQQLDLVV